MKYIVIFALIIPCVLFADGEPLSQYKENDLKDTVQPLGRAVFDNSYSPSQIIYELYGSKVFEESGELKVDVSIPVITDKQVMVEDTSGLPDFQNDEDLEQASITVPFSIDVDPKMTAENQISELVENMDSVLEKLKAKPNSGSINKDALNMPNCGGYPIGTIITTFWQREWPLCRSYKTKYTCLNISGVSNWYITSQISSVLPCEYEP